MAARQPVGGFMKRIHLPLLPAALAALLIAGCSSQSKSEYGQAGQSLKNAAQETGKAIRIDAKVAGKAVRNAAAGAKATTQKTAANVKKETAEHDGKN